MIQSLPLKAEGPFAPFRAPFMRHLKQANRAPATIKNYLGDLEAFVRWFTRLKGVDFHPAAIQSEDLESYRQFLAAEQRLKPASINRKLAALQTFLGWAKQIGLVPQQSLLQSPEKLQQPARQLQSLTPAQQTALLHAVEQSCNRRDLAVVKLLLTMGLQVQELCSLCWEHVQVVDGKAFLELQRRKGKLWSQLQIPQDIYALLLSLKQETKLRYLQPFFQGQRGSLTARGVQLCLKKYGKAIDVPTLSPQMLRHTCAFNFARSGLGAESLAVLMGFSSLEATNVYYTTELRQALVNQALSKAYESAP